MVGGPHDRDIQILRKQKPHPQRESINPVQRRSAAMDPTASGAHELDRFGARKIGGKHGAGEGGFDGGP